MTESPSQTSSSVDVLRRRARRRLVGAALLALIAAIALPLMFEKEPPPLADEVDIRIPNVEKTPFEPKPITAAPKEPPKEASKAPDATKPITLAPAVETVAAVVPKPTAPVEVAPKVPEKTVLPVAETKPAEKTAEKKLEPAKTTESEKTAEATPVDPDGPKTTPVTGDYVVQLLAVRDGGSAQKALARARELGYKTAYREKLDVANGQVTRVRVGPYKEKEFAEKIRNKLIAQEFEAVVVLIK